MMTIALCWVGLAVVSTATLFWMTRGAAWMDPNAHD